MSLRNILFLRKNFQMKFSTNASSAYFSNEWKTVIGLEIHAQLSTKTKLFSAAAASYGAPTNSLVSLFDAAIPGTLPALNKTAVELAVISSLALGCKINPVSLFDRKHYFYSDLPSGYQITQQRLPLAVDGKVEYAIYQPGIHSKPYYKESKIKQIQLEQDSGKSLHETTEKKSYTDLNRAGIALIEIVFQPDIEDGEEASALVKEVIKILGKVGSCSCKMEEGALRVDANVSVRKKGSESAVRTEIKNIGSVHGVNKAVEYEARRQVDIIKNGGTIKNETLLWDAELNKTVVMRDKEETQDYRFMPEPNLPPLRLIIDENSENIHKNVKARKFIYDVKHLKSRIPSLPQDERMLLKEKHSLSDLFAYNLVNQDKLLTYFKEIMLENPSRDPRITYLLLMYQLLNALKSKNLALENCSVRFTHLGQIVDLVQSKKISRATSENIVVELVEDDNRLSPIEMVKKQNLEIISNPKELKKICSKVLEREHAAVALYIRKKKKTVFNELFRKILEESNHRADTRELSKVLSQLLVDTKDPN